MAALLQPFFFSTKLIRSMLSTLVSVCTEEALGYERRSATTPRPTSHRNAPTFCSGAGFVPSASSSCPAALTLRGARGVPSTASFERTVSFSLHTFV